ncbi:hypothetical protein G4G27_20130 [Sphingomonas sp. So64.6b]|uniref:hypothetical protein n=1 Tax=Sphingomonas sp. So64.6b TaxID=2997354 RepID=UPI001601921A|nr:hypothetical protein [Sphingomonas sp. So64.6b]QNA86032.1 hypothetical protein G4G27_20130 [Sphingomonas sp. So64.6b]
MALMSASPVMAGTYADDLGKCLVAKSSEPDKLLLVQWVFAAMSAHPAVKSMSTVTPTQRAGFNKAFATMTNRLLFADCRKEMVLALKYEGAVSVEISFSLLGQIAMRGLMSDPSVTVELEQIGTFIDAVQLAAVAKEAGIPVPPAPK